MPNPKLESRMTIPSSGGITFNDGGGNETVTFTEADEYYLSSAGDQTYGLMADIEDQINDVGGNFSGTLTVALTADGRCTISSDGANFTATWGVTWVRDALGFTQGNLSGAATYTSDDACQGLWLPGVPAVTLNKFDTSATTLWTGTRHSDLHGLRSMSGFAWVYSGPYLKKIDRMPFFGILPRKMFIQDETYVNESAESFWHQCIYGAEGFATPGGPIRFYPDLDDATVFASYKVLGNHDFAPEQFEQDFWGAYNWALLEMIQLPGEY